MLFYATIFVSKRHTKYPYRPIIRTYKKSRAFLTAHPLRDNLLIASCFKISYLKDCSFFTSSLAFRLAVRPASLLRLFAHLISLLRRI